MSPRRSKQGSPDQSKFKANRGSAPFMKSAIDFQKLNQTPLENHVTYSPSSSLKANPLSHRMLLSTKTKSEKFLLHKDKQIFQSTSLAEIKEMKSKEKAGGDVDGPAINKYSTLITASGELNRKSPGHFFQKAK